MKGWVSRVIWFQFSSLIFCLRELTRVFCVIPDGNSQSPFASFLKSIAYKFDFFLLYKHETVKPNIYTLELYNVWLEKDNKPRVIRPRAKLFPALLFFPNEWVVLWCSGLQRCPFIDKSHLEAFILYIFSFCEYKLGEMSFRCSALCNVM